MIKPFRIDIPQADLDDLTDRLARTRWPNEVADAGRDHGFPLARLAELAEYWRTGYDWREHEAELNELPHFYHRDRGPEHPLRPRPVVETGRARAGPHPRLARFVPRVPRRDRAAVPRLPPGDPVHPGYGFSGPTHERGWDIVRIARAWAELMRRLGYERYSAQGGDFGAGISLALGSVAPEQVVGAHINYLPTGPGRRHRPVRNRQGPAGQGQTIPARRSATNGCSPTSRCTG